jgi:DNA-binding transcriptional regulator YhcF (GntR family)
MCHLAAVGKPTVCADAACPTSTVSIDEPSPIPWRRIRADLAKQIETGVLEPGDEVVIIHEATDHGVTHKVARRAILALVDEGALLSTRRGDGRLGFIVTGEAGCAVSD